MINFNKLPGSRADIFARFYTPKAVALTLLMGVFSLIILGTASLSSAQQRGLNSDDQLAILYAPQLKFTPEGDPIIRVALVEGAESVQFTPSEPIRVLPQGESGPEIELPGGRKYTVQISQPRPGAYKHWVVVDSLSVAQRAQVEPVTQQWTKRNFIPETFEVGGLFGIQGKTFDSRQILVAVGGASRLKDAQKLQRELEAKYGIEGRIHSEITRFPGALLTLSGEGLDLTIRNANTLWIAPKKGREEEIRYSIPGIKKSYQSGRETRIYTGKLVFAPDKDGSLVAMTSLGAERLLAGVVPAEIYASAPPEALKAQAVAARNEIFAAIGVRNLADPYMQRADVFDQVYGGVGVEDARTTRAVKETRGEVMFHGDQIIEAVYSSNAGGFTENNENVWDAEARPYLRGKPDAPADKIPAAFKKGVTSENLETFLTSDMPAYSKIAPIGSTKYYRWEASAEVDQVQKWLAEHGHKVGKLRSAKILSRGVSGRVIRLELVGSAGKAVVERELNVRQLFGGLKSGLFLMDYSTNSRGEITQLQFRGAGFGHGVGMCQTGAMGMAHQKKSYQNILTHYYTGIKLRRLY